MHDGTTFIELDRRHYMLVPSKQRMGAGIDRGFSDLTLEIVNLGRHAGTPMHIDDQNVHLLSECLDIVPQSLQVKRIGPADNLGPGSRIFEQAALGLVSRIGLERIDARASGSSRKTC